MMFPARMRSAVQRLAIAAAATMLTAAVAPAIASADIGTKDYSYVPMTGSPTGSKPESKLWFNDGIWWASMFDPATSDHFIYRLNRTTQVWSKTAAKIDARVSSRADTMWDASAGKLYVASHGYTTTASTSTSNNGRLWRYSYNATTKAYTLDSGFPAAGLPINTARSETLVIDKDSTGRLWATWTLGNRVYVNHTNGNDATWGTPYILPTAGTTLNADDISSLIHFGGNKIGVMWSNQVDSRFYFAVHADGGGDAAANWTATALPAPTTNFADDHINLKADSTGRVYAAVKHSTSGNNALNSLLVRSTAGVWTNHAFGRVADSHTRPIVQLDEANGLIHMFATGPSAGTTSGQSGGDIVQKTSPINAISFVAGVGTRIISQTGSPKMNDATSTKQNATAASGLVVGANNATTDVYWHADLGAGSEPPPPPPPGGVVADFTGTPVSGTSPLAVQFTDASTGTPTTWAWTFGDGGTANAQNPLHTYTTDTIKTYDVSLTASDGGTSSTKTRTQYVTVNPPPPPPGSGTTFNPVADAQVKSTSATANYGTLATLRVRNGTGTTDLTFYRTYLRFTVSGLSGPVTSAKLRLFVTDASPDGGSVYAVSDNSWVESGTGAITWNNKPALGAVVAAGGATEAVGSYTEINLGAGAVSADGTYSFALDSTSSNSAIYSSREDAVNKPQLVLTTG